MCWLPLAISSSSDMKGALWPRYCGQNNFVLAFYHLTILPLKDIKLPKLLKIKEEIMEKRIEKTEMAIKFNRKCLKKLENVMEANK